MNLNRYEKIDGREALKRLLNGETVYGRNSSEWRFKDNGEVIYQTKIGTRFLGVKLNDFLKNKHLYVKKPLDVRQALLDRPNEWVAAYNDERGKWIQVGFDTVNMRLAKAYYGYTGGVEGANGDFPTGYELETCIPIEDVPEEATR